MNNSEFSQNGHNYPTLKFIFLARLFKNSKLVVQRGEKGIKIFRDLQTFYVNIYLSF